MSTKQLRRRVFKNWPQKLVARGIIYTKNFDVSRCMHESQQGVVMSYWFCVRVSGVEGWHAIDYRDWTDVPFCDVYSFARLVHQNLRLIRRRLK